MLLDEEGDPMGASHRILLAALALSCSMLSLTSDAGATDHVVFSANFNADTVDEWPNTSPIGDPADDSLWYYQAAPFNGASSIVYSSFWQLTDKPLVVSRPAGGYMKLYFLFDPTYTDCGSYTVTFDAMAGNALGFVYFTLNEIGYRSIVSIGFADDPAPNISGQGPITLWSSNDVTSVRWYEAQAQSFRIELDVEAGTFSLFIDEAAVPEATDHPIYVGNHDGTFGSMAMNFGGTTDAVMAIDNIEVIAHCATVKTESASWGSIKSLWK